MSQSTRSRPSKIPPSSPARSVTSTTPSSPAKSITSTTADGAGWNWTGGFQSISRRLIGIFVTMLVVMRVRNATPQSEEEQWADRKRTKKVRINFTGEPEIIPDVENFPTQELPDSEKMHRESQEGNGKFDSGRRYEEESFCSKYKKIILACVSLILIGLAGFLIWYFVYFEPEVQSTSPPTLAPTVSTNHVAPPTLAPTISTNHVAPRNASKVALEEFLQNYYNTSSSSEAASTAVQWLVDEAQSLGLKELPLTMKTVQRFALISLEYAMMSDDTSNWNSTQVTTNRSLQYQENPSKYGIAINGTENNGNASTPWYDAAAGRDECSWDGVVCNSHGEIIQLLLGNSTSNKKGGTLATELGLLTRLQFLDFSKNDLVGKIPEQLWELTSLVKVYLYKNQFEGTLSTSISNLLNLTHFHASHNRLSGPLPSTMKSTTIKGIFPIEYLNLYSNRFSGNLPTGMKLRKARFVDLGRNQFSGSIPEDFGSSDFIRLRYLHLDHNALNGTLPSSLMNAGNGRLKALTLDNNEFTGALPGNHSLLDNKLTELTVHKNKLESMDQGTCSLSVAEEGELVEFKSDCNICTCGNQTIMCENCVD